MCLRPTTAALALVVMPAVTLMAQEPAAQVTWYPARPSQGSLLRVAVRWPEATSLRGTLAGEALHFERDTAGTFHGVGAIPIDADGEVRGLMWAGRRPDSVPLTVAVAVRRVRSERLRLAPEYVAPPDSALAARVATERAQISAALARAHAVPRLWGSLWFSPPRRSDITSSFGTRRVLNGETQSRHMGLDYNGVVGDPVRATNRGVVILVGDFFYNGKCIYVAHGAGLVTSYLHLSAAHVTVGDTVARGQVIGAVGASGRVTGPHLHWSVLYGRISVDPLSLLSLRPLPTGVDGAPSPTPPSHRLSVWSVPLRLNASGPVSVPAPRSAIAPVAAIP
ncbi:MAG TPA: M23 family metallopeptidase [Gemmatimonadales bacterium]